MNKHEPRNLLETTRLDLVVVALMLLLVVFPLRAGEIQSLISIRLQAEAFISAHPYKSPYPAQFQVGNLDSRLRLKACPEALQIDFANRDRVQGNSALLVRCAAKPSWKIHLPVRVDIFDDVIVAAKPLIKGQIIDETAVSLEKQNTLRLKNGYYAKNSAPQGLEAKRNLARGTVLTPRNLTPRLLVRSGQRVTLVLHFNGLQVKSTGRALQSASLGQLIKVRNSQSLKIVEGVVTGDGQVRVTI